MGRHLKLGELILQQRHIADINLFSYTYPQFPFFNHHWGSEVMFYLIHQRFGVNGLIIMSLLLTLGAVGLLFSYVRTRAAVPGILIAGLVPLEIMRERIDIRPEMFGYFFFAFLLWCLYREKEHSSRMIWIVPLVMLLWVNLHITFIFGFLAFGCFVLDRLLTRTMKRTYLYIFGAMVVAVCVNPHGIQGASYPFNIFSNYGYQITENQSPFFLETLMNNPTIFWYKVGLGMSLFVSPLLLWKRKFYEVLVMVVTSVLSYQAIRHFPFYALASIVPFAVGVTYLMNGFIQTIKEVRLLVYGVSIVVSCMLIIFIGYDMYGLLSNTSYVMTYQLARTGFGQVAGGTRLLDYFQENNLHGPIFNNFDIGSYIVYRLYPHEKVFVDGRPEAYPATFFSDVYIPMQYDAASWENAVKTYNISTIIMSHTDATPWGRAFVKRIVTDERWKLVYFDDWGMLLVRTDTAPDTLHSIDSEEEFTAYAYKRLQATNDPALLARYANFFQIIGRNDLFQEIVKRIQG